jgi:hypothetical protein
MPLKKEILYPIFLKCCKYTSDSFWENIFEDLSYGKTPYGTYISKNFLCCNYKKKEFSYKIDKKKDPELLYKEIYTLLTDKLGLLSNKEQIKRKKIFNDIEKNIKESRKSWNNIRKKNIKELLIELFVSDMKNKYSLTLKQSRKLLSIIFIGMVFKVITSKDIEYVDGKIINIKGIKFDKKKIIIEKKLYTLEKDIKPEIIIEKKIMKENWEKYIKELQKQSLTL